MLPRGVKFKKKKKWPEELRLKRLLSLQREIFIITTCMFGLLFNDPGLGPQLPLIFNFLFVSFSTLRNKGGENCLRRRR